MLSALVRGSWILVLCVILGMGLGAGASLFAGPNYQSSIYLLVVSDPRQTDAASALNYTQAYGKLATAPTVVGEVFTARDIEPTPESINEAANVEISPDSPMFQIIVNSANPEDASRLANELGSTVSSYTEELADRTGYRAEVAAEAVPPVEPDSPDLGLNIAVGGAIGLLTGGVLALLWDARKPARKN